MFIITADSGNRDETVRINITSATELTDLPITSQPPPSYTSTATKHPRSTNIISTTSPSQATITIALSIGLPASIILIVGIVIFLFRTRGIASCYPNPAHSLSLYTENPAYEPFNTNG